MEHTMPMFSIVRHLGILTTEKQKTVKEVNLVRWGNAKKATLDIRKWDEKGNPLRGISLSDDEVKALCEILREAYASYFS